MIVRASRAVQGTTPGRANKDARRARGYRAGMVASSSGSATPRRPVILPALVLFVLGLVLFALVIFGLVSISGGDPKPTGTTSGLEQSASP
jgi:hypothetical protein